MMKRIVLALAAMCLLAACGNKPGKNEITPSAIAGSWELSDVVTKASVGSVTVSVYITFVSEGTFTLYQKIGEGRYTKFSGTFTLAEQKLSGKYSDGKSWGPYNTELDGSTLTLSKEGGVESDIYRKIEAIPAEVTSNMY